MGLKERLDGADDRNRDERARWLLLAAVGLTFLLQLIPFGGLIGWPLVLLSTFVHEIGHGLTALLVGARFEAFYMFGDASGFARWSGSPGPGARALIAAGGLVGPAVAALFGFLAARREQVARGFLIGLVVVCAALLALFVRGPVGIGFVLALMAGIGWVVWKKPEWAQLLLVFLSVQLAISVFSRGDYLFTATAMTGAGEMPSDTAHMAEALGGTYWLWGLACGAFSVGVLVLGMWIYLRGGPELPKWRMPRFRRGDAQD